MGRRIRGIVLVSASCLDLLVLSFPLRVELELIRLKFRLWKGSGREMPVILAAGRQKILGMSCGGYMTKGKGRNLTI